MHRRMLLLAICLPLIVVVLIGCESAPKAASLINLAVKDFERQDYEQASIRANDAMRSARGVDRDKATYVAGLSAFELGRLDEAERRFLGASRSSDATVAANAKAMLGQIRLDQARYDDAARLLEDAALNLRGEDARQASQLARAARHHSVGGAAESSGRFRIETTHTSTLPASGFALQAGAFQDRSRANRAAEEARRIAEQGGLGPVSVVPTTDSRGRTLYVVRIGHFTTRHAADQARSRVGRLDYIVAAWPRTSSGG